jgi:hypothetical protein
VSYSSQQVFAAGTLVADVREFVELLSYRRLGILRYETEAFEEYFFFDETDYRSWSGVELAIHNEQRGVVVSTRSTVSRSYYDLTHQNHTIRSLRKRFGGDFTTDEGRNRYLQPRFEPPTPAASGCHLAYERFGSNLIKAASFHSSRQFDLPQQPVRQGYSFLLEHDPRVMANNALLPFLIAALEDYFKSTFVVLLRYSPRKEAFFKGIRLQGDQLAAISGGAKVEDQVVETLPFQRISAVMRHFAALDSSLDVGGALRKPFRRRKESLFDQLERVVETRHAIIHRATLDVSLTDLAILDLIHDLDVAVTRVYKRIADHYSWPFERGWFLGRRTRQKVDGSAV